MTRNDSSISVRISPLHCDTLAAKPLSSVFAFPSYLSTLKSRSSTSNSVQDFRTHYPLFFTFSVFSINLGTDPTRTCPFGFLDFRKMKSETSFFNRDILSPASRFLQKMNSSGEELQFENLLWTKNIQCKLKKKMFRSTRRTFLDRRISSLILAQCLISLFCFLQSNLNFVFAKLTFCSLK